MSADIQLSCLGNLLTILLWTGKLGYISLASMAIPCPICCCNIRRRPRWRRPTPRPGIGGSVSENISTLRTSPGPTGPPNWDQFYKTFFVVIQVPVLLGFYSNDTTTILVLFLLIMTILGALYIGDITFNGIT